MRPCRSGPRPLIWFLGALLIGLAGCDEATAPRQPERYVLRMVHGYPLPYFDFETRFSSVGGTLELKLDGRFEQVRDMGYLKDVTGGTYRRLAGRIELMPDVGDVETYLESDGILTNEGSVYIREGLEIPPEYRWTTYRLDTCDGFEPTTTPSRPCPGGRYGSVIWLGETGAYYVLEDGVGATIHDQGQYTVDGDRITLAGMPDHRAAGTLHADTLTLGSWVYLRAE